MHLIGSIIIGFVVGLVARFLKPGRDPMGFILTTILGIAGAVIATYIGRGLGWYGPEDGAGFIASVVGAFLVLGAYSLITRGSTRGTGITSDRDRWAA